ncbi:MAG: sigma-54-dependent Fis family transcriptional regulator [Blastocatellia bacterium AA13]|nr:MAG: sigma-54-dependent Fis family transcriptional regulator [Blastocatellia bacterium AA13]
MAKNKVLIVDDEPGIRFGLRDYLEINGFGVEESSSAREALDKFQSFRPDVVIADYLLEDGNALDLLAKLRAAAPEIPVIILTGHGSIDLAVRAIKEGAEQFLTKPVELPALLIMMQRLIENTRNRHKQMARASVQAREAVDPFRGTSAAIRDLAEQASRVMASDSAVLIQGETGTGKGVLAHWLHNNGPRADEAFVDLNCAGLAPEFLETELFGHEKGAFTSAVSSKQGLLEVAHRGTVFLDEIGDVDLHVQPKLLKVLEEKRFRRLGAVRDLAVDIRLIAATHQDLATLVREKKFRSDLYFRISTIPLMVPSLAQRPEDIPILAEHLLRSLGPDLGRGQIELTLDAVKALQSYGWPGNIRELRNVLERALLLSDQSVLRAADLRFESNGASDIWTESSDMTLLEFEQRLIERVINEEHGRVEQAARRLAIPKSSLYQKIKKYGIVVSRH